MYKSVLNATVTDIVAASRRYGLVGMLGWQDVRQRYRRSSLGPLWLTISMGAYDIVRLLNTGGRVS